MEIDVQSRVPIYEQIVNHLRQQILYGELKPAEKLPSIRLLAKKLQVNPNTIKKSYQVLEKQQLVKSNSTKGTFVTTELEHLLEERIKESFEAITLETKELKKMGVSLKRVVEGIEKKWKVL